MDIKVILYKNICTIFVAVIFVYIGNIYQKYLCCDLDITNITDKFDIYNF